MATANRHAHLAHTCVSAGLRGLRERLEVLRDFRTSLVVATEDGASGDRPVRARERRAAEDGFLAGDRRVELALLRMAAGRVDDRLAERGGPLRGPRVCRGLGSLSFVHALALVV
jgi:hypothetical protein